MKIPLIYVEEDWGRALQIASCNADVISEHKETEDTLAFYGIDEDQAWFKGEQPMNWLGTEELKGAESAHAHNIRAVVTMTLDRIKKGIEC